MADRWAADLVEALRGTGSGSESRWIFAKIKTANPLTILTHDQTISRNLYINPALTVRASNGGNLIAPEFEGLPSSPFPFLKEFHQKFVIQPGDMVLVLQAGVSFYIAGKVAAV